MWLRFTLILPIMMKNMISAKWILFAAATACVVAAAAAPGAKPEPRTSETTVSVADFGAVPDDGKDDTRALRRAAEYCRTHPGTTLLFPAGVYRLRDAAAERLEREVLSGKMGPNPEEVIFKPYYPYVRGLDFSGSEQVTVEAHGAVLLCEGWMEPLSIVDSRDFTLRGLTIDYLRKPFSEGVVTQIGEESFTVQFRPDHEITPEIPLPRMALWDGEISGTYREALYYAERTLLGNNLVRFKGRIPGRMEGAAVVFPHSFHFRPAILILGSERTRLEDVTIHSQPGMGIVGFDSRDIAMRGLSVAPADGYTFSTNTDATHFACCEGTISFDGCLFRGQGDDATNVHGYYHDIAAISGDTVTLELKSPTFTHAQVADVPRVGDRMEVVRISTLVPEGEVEVTEVFHREDAPDVRIRIRGTLPEYFGEYCLFNVSKLPRLEFRRSIVWGNLARGVLCKTRGVVIEDNIFRACTGTAIHVGAESFWKEGTHATDVTISRNVMIDCGLGAGCQYGASGIAVVVSAPDTVRTILHDGIRIEENTIRGTGENECGIAVRNARNVVLRGNRIEGCRSGVITSATENLTAE